MALEGPASVRHKQVLYQEYRQFLLSRKLSRVNVEKLIRVQEITCKQLRGNPWSYRHSLHLAYSIITTIGFGELAPITPLGKLTVIGYGTLGIVLNILCLASLRLLFSMLIYRLLWWYVRYKQGITRRARSVAKVTFTLLLICALWTVTSIFTLTRSHGNWSWFLSWYSTFIAATTIGFGDMVILDDFNDGESITVLEHMLQFLFMINIVLILALFSTLFELLKQTNVRRVSKRVSHIVNIIHQTQIQSRINNSGLNPILGVGRELAAGSVVEVMPTIRESESERESHTDTDRNTDSSSNSKSNN
ncbi:two pore potassium channel protein sup-9-like [Bolinopsis microptera]|uniref:two pore potassium channel protein sup-9-like n=1 Tax=Bolinopsis microptera TaxID=2820187 RepID=UPI00307A60DE